MRWHLGKGWVVVFSMLLCLYLLGPIPARADGYVTITDRGNYFEVVIDVRGGHKLSDAASEYIDDLKAAVPDFESLGDSYINDLITAELGDELPLPASMIYQYLLQRVEDFKSQIPEEYRDLIQGVGDKLSGGTTNVLGDDKLSVDEAFLLNLTGDVVRATQCSSLSVWGSRSATGSTITTRNFEWYAGSRNQLAQLHAVTTIKTDEGSVCTVGFLGLFAAVSILNNHGVFAGLLDSPSGATYSSTDKRSYPFDLLYAMLHYSTIDEIAAYMSDPEHHYAYNHDIIFSDGSRAVVLENNFSGTGSDMHRALRTWDSELQDGITWGFDNALCVVNSFLLKGNQENQYLPGTGNQSRWERYKSLLADSGQPVDQSRMEAIAGGDGSGPGGTDSIYEDQTLQIIAVQPGVPSWRIFFRPKDGNMPTVPSFEDVPISFD